MSRFPPNIRFEYRECHPSNFTSGTWRKDFITLHWWDDPSRRPQFDGVVSWFQNPAANVSIQYMVEAGRITQMIPESAMAWHAGNSTANRHGIGIEVNPRLSSGDYETTAQLVAEIWRRRGSKLPLRRHREFTGTNCPGTMDVARIQRRANQIYSGSGTSTPSAPAVTTPSPKEKPLSLTQANIDAIAQRVMTTTIKSGFSGNNVMTQTAIRQTQEALTNGRVFRNTIESGITGNNVMVQTALRQTQQRADKAARQTDEIKAMVSSGITELAEQLDSLKPGLAAAVKDAVAEAAEEVRREQVEISAREVAEELEVTARAAAQDEEEEED